MRLASDAAALVALDAAVAHRLTVTGTRSELQLTLAASAKGGTRQFYVALFEASGGSH